MRPARASCPARKSLSSTPRGCPAADAAGKNSEPQPKESTQGCGPIKQYNNVFGKRHDYSCRFSVQGTNILHLMPCFCLSTRNAKLSTSGSLFSSAHRLSIRVSKFADSSTALSISTSTQFSSIDYKIHAMACQEMPTPVAYHAFSHS